MHVQKALDCCEIILAGKISRIMFCAKYEIAPFLFGRAQIPLLRNVIKEVASHLVPRRRHVPKDRQAKRASIRIHVKNTGSRNFLASDDTSTGESV